ncbi:MAG: hypothetical protein QG578_856, partial [Thermodesulfobacteriota bacterium]|nr:hypothetical protein [Thermodesulfobacteriota bacterium]
PTASSGECARISVQTEESIFFREWVASGQPQEQIPISAVCNSRCLFCSNRMNPFPIKQNIFRDIEDVKLQLSLGSANYDGAIHMSDSLPGRISEGEAFLHPRFFEILNLVREKHLTNSLHFTTNASMLDEPFVRKLAQFRPIEINISLHSTQPKLWARIFQRTEKPAKTALSSLNLLKKYNIDFTGTIVTLPRICGWGDLEKTFGYLADNGAKSILLWWPGYSIKTPGLLKKKIVCPWDEFRDFSKRMQKKFPKIPVVPQPNMSETLGLPVKRIMNSTLLGNLKTFGGEFRKVLWLASEAAYPEIARMVGQAAKSVSNEHRVFPVKNISYGGNIQVSGLLMVSDFLSAGKKALKNWPDTDLILIPGMAFDAFSRDLLKTPAFKIPEILERTTWLISENGAFHQLIGRGFVRPENDPRKTFEKILKFIDESIREDNFDAISSIVASFPVPTSSGLLNKREFRNFLKLIKSRFSSNTNLDKRILEKLNDNRILCMEDWQEKDLSSPFSRWLFFKKTGKVWRLEMIFLGQETGEDRRLPSIRTSRLQHK